MKEGCGVVVRRHAISNWDLACSQLWEHIMWVDALGLIIFDAQLPMELEEKCVNIM